MPLIRSYTRQISAPGDQGFEKISGAELGGATSRALGQFGSAVSGIAKRIEKRQEQQELSDTTTKMAQANNALASDLQNVVKTTTPGDRKPFEAYNKRVDESLANIGNDLSSRNAKNYHALNSERIKGHLVRSSVQHQSESAGIKAVTDYTNSINAYSSTVLSDPSSLDLQKQLHREGVDQLILSGQIPTSKGHELKAQGDRRISKNAVRGWIRLNPDFAKEKLKSGEFDEDLGGEAKIQMFAEADQAIRGKEIEAERRRKEDERVKRAKQTETQNKFVSSMSEGSLTSKDILESNLDPFGSGSKEQFLRLIQAKGGGAAGPPKTSSRVFTNLFNRIHLNPEDPNAIRDENDLNAFVGKGLSFPDMQKLRKEIQGFGTVAGADEKALKTNFLTIAKSALVKGDTLSGIKDPVGDEQLQKFLGVYLDEYNRLRKEGKSAQELLNPTSKDYLGHMLEPFRRSPQQIMKDIASGFTRKTPEQIETERQAQPEKPVRKQGESSVEFLERLNTFNATSGKSGN